MLREVDTERVIELARLLAESRYRIGLVVGKNPVNLTKLALATSDRLKAHYVSLLGLHLDVPESGAVGGQLGVFDQHDLTNWLLTRSARQDARFIVVDQLEPLVATFGRSGATKFLETISVVEPKTPLILFTYLKSQALEGDFPRNRIVEL